LGDYTSKLGKGIFSNQQLGMRVYIRMIMMTMMIIIIIIMVLE